MYHFGVVFEMSVLKVIQFPWIHINDIVTAILSLRISCYQTANVKVVVLPSLAEECLLEQLDRRSLLLYAKQTTFFIFMRVSLYSWVFSSSVSALLAC